MKIAVEVVDLVLDELDPKTSPSTTTDYIKVDAPARAYNAVCMEP